MAEDPPGPTERGNHVEPSGEAPTGRGSPPAQPTEPPPSYGQPEASWQQGYGPPPAPPSQPQQYGYGPAGYGYPPAPQTETMATAALVVAIVGFFVCFPLGGVVALILANSASRNIEASGGRLTGLEQARAARIIAIVELVLTGVLVLLLVVAGAVALVVSSNSGYDEPVPGIVRAAYQAASGR